MKEIVEREARWHSYIYICGLQIHHLVAVSSGQGQGTHRWTRWGKGTQESKWGCRHRSSLRGKTYRGNKLTFRVEASGSRFLQLTLGSDKKSVEC